MSCRGGGRLYSALASDEAATSVGDPPHRHPWWVTTLNDALEVNAAATLVAFVALDIGSALLLWAAILACNVPVDADFAIAYALCKGPLKVARLALDGTAAAALARRCPSLAAVRVSLLVDAAVNLVAKASALAGTLTQGSSARATAPPAARPAKPEAKPPSKAVAEARRMADTFGLAYMAAKNVLGPLTILVVYALLRAGVGVQGRLAALLGDGGGTVAGAAGGAQAMGRAAASMALASWCSTLLFPGVVLGAAVLGPALDRFVRRFAEKSN